MTDTHPITPPPELVQQWMAEPEYGNLGQVTLYTLSETRLTQIVTRSAQWGADQELEACCVIALTDPVCGTKHQRRMLVSHIHEQRRPKPSSLKEQAFEALKLLQYRTTDPNIIEPIRCALEQLDD